MRRAASAILGLLLVFGSSFTMPGHVHAAPESHASVEASGIHLDHIHPAAGHHAHSSPPESDAGMETHHPGTDAVPPVLVGSQAVPKRGVSFVAIMTLEVRTPEAPLVCFHAQAADPDQATQPRDRPPGRAPPA